MKIIKTISELRAAVKSHRANGKTIGFVPTMGALHAGHLSLIDIAQKKADIVVCSIFVNKAQFAPNEDFDKYPRQDEEDLAKLKGMKIDIAYLPSQEQIYPEGSSLSVSVGDIGKQLEGEARPHFFDGVALIVTKLFMQVSPDITVFGEKDYQQLVIVKKIARELDVPVEIIGAPVCREEDGLAMSSRNIYLSAEQRSIAPNLFKILCSVKEKINNSQDILDSINWGKEKILASGFESVDYLELRDAETLDVASDASKPSRLLVVARLGGIRLLDNIAI